MHPEFVNHLGGVFALSSLRAPGTGAFEQNMHWSATVWKLFGYLFTTLTVQL